MSFGVCLDANMPQVQNWVKEPQAFWPPDMIPHPTPPGSGPEHEKTNEPQQA